MEGALVVVIFTWMLLRTKKVIASYMAKSGALGHIDVSTIEFVWKILTIVIVFISALIALNILGVDVMPLIAFGGVGAAAIGISAKDVLANFFGGLMIYLSRPFKIGDLVKIPKENIEGVIERIGWYYTSIRNLEMTPMYVPNSIFSTAQIHNSSRCSNRRIEENIEIGSDSFGKLSSILQDIRDMIGKDKDIDNSQSNLVFFNAIGAYSLVIYIRIYTYKNSLEEYYEIKQRILSQIRDIIYGKGAEIPYPTNVVKIEKI
jgi:MscS family membrane protein